MTSVQRNWGGDKVFVDDDSDWNGEAVRSTVVRRMPAGSELATDRVEAYTHCPHCGTEAFHGMRAPASVREVMAEPVKYLTQHLSEVRGQFGPKHPPMVHFECEFEVIRTCECGAEWGQK